MLGFLLCARKHHRLRLVERDARNALQFLLLLLIQFVDLFLDLVELLGALVQLLFAVLHALQLFIERFLALEQPALGALQFRSALSVFLFGVVAKLVNLFLRFQHLFLSDLLGLLLCVVIQPLDGVFRLFDLRFRHVLAIEVTDHESDRRADQDARADHNVMEPLHGDSSPIYINITEQNCPAIPHD